MDFPDPRLCPSIPAEIMLILVNIPSMFDFWGDLLAHYIRSFLNTYWIFVLKIYFLECRENSDSLAYRTVNSVTVKEL